MHLASDGPFVLVVLHTATSSLMVTLHTETLDVLSAVSWSALFYAQPHPGAAYRAPLVAQAVWAGSTAVAIDDAGNVAAICMPASQVRIQA